MSQINVDRIVDSSGGVFAPVSSVHKNRIINGDCRIDQRNAGASVTPSTGAQQYTIDRWMLEYSQTSKLTVQQNAGLVTPPSGFTKYLGITVASAVSIGAGDYFDVQQRIEGFNTADLGWGTANAQTVTLSFWVRSSLTGTFGGALGNSAGNRSYPFSYTITSANTWEQKSVTIAGDTTGTWSIDNLIGIKLVFSLGIGSTFSGTAGAWAAGNFASSTGATSVVGTSGATFYITGVQLEVGTQATSFEYRQYTTELQLCQRYFQQIDYLSSNGGIAANWYYWNLGFLTQMRAAPILAAATAYASNTGNAHVVQGGVAVSGWVLEQSTPSSASVRGSNTSVSQAISGRGWFSSEL
jgi:hypothetical protein